MFEQTIIIFLFSKFIVGGRPTLSFIKENKESLVALL
jgi:hypothetical protein